MSRVLVPHQGHFSLQQIETIAENHIQTKYRVVEPSSKRYSYGTSPRPQAQEALKGGGKIVCQMSREFARRVYFLGLSEVT